MPAQALMTRAKTEDAELLLWLEPFAKYGRQGDVLRLALYLASGLDIPETLDDLLDDLPGLRRYYAALAESEPVPLPPPAPMPVFDFDALGERLAEALVESAKINAESQRETVGVLREVLEQNSETIDILKPDGWPGEPGATLRH